MLKHNVDRCYFYYSELPPEIRPIYRKRIRLFTCMLAIEYPGFRKWFDNMFVKEDKISSDREIIICEYRYQLAGVAILKKTYNENKICTLRVDKRFRGEGIGREMIEQCFCWLEDEHPVMTVQRWKEPQFRSILSYYDFRLEQENRSYYRFLSTELAYNGILPDRDFQVSKIQSIGLAENIARYIVTGVKTIDSLTDTVFINPIVKAGYTNYIPVQN